MDRWRSKTIRVHAVRLLVQAVRVMGAKYVVLPHKTSFMGAIAPTAPMVRTPMPLMWHIHCCWKLAKRFSFMHALYRLMNAKTSINATTVGSGQMA